MDMEIVSTSGTDLIEVPDDAAADFQDAYEALAKLPVTRMVNVTFNPEDYPKTEKETSEQLAAKAARLWVRQGRAWAPRQNVSVKDKEGNEVRRSHLEFRRMGDAKENPTRVSFRIYVPRAPKA